MAFNFSFTQSFSFSGGGGGGGGYDTDAQAYITAVETADSASLETGVKDAINSFVVYCKAQGIWTAINASCILAGARTLSGALVPLKGTAPTNFNFVSGDYNRETGLKGDASTKYLDTNRNANADPQDSYHQTVYGTELITSGFLMGAGTASGDTGRSNILANRQCRNRQNATSGSSLTPSAPFVGHSRTSSAGYTIRANGADQSITQASITSINRNVLVFGTSTTANALSTPSAERIAFYSIGEAIDLTKLETAVTTLINAYAAAIP
jgi:hypothetical protein